MNEWEHIVRQHPEPLLCVDESACVVMANDVARQIFGDYVTTGASWLELGSLSEAQWSRIKSDTSSSAIEVRFNNSTFSFVHRRLEASTTILIVGHDRTASVQSENELRRQQQIVADIALFPHMNPSPVLRLDRDGCIVLNNNAAEELFSGPLKGANWLQLCPDMTSELWEHIISIDTIYQHHVDFGHACFIFSHRIDPESGLVFVFGNDITSLELAQRELTQQKSELAEIARFPDMNPGPVLRMNYAGDVLLCNTAAQIVFGIDLRGRNWLETLPGLTESRWNAVMQSTAIDSIEVVLNGRAYVFHHRHDPTTELIFVFGTDITLQRLAEQTLRQSERMATLGTLAAGIAHELNNPAAAATRAAQQMEVDFQALQTVRMSIDRMGLQGAEADMLSLLVNRARGTAEHEVLLSPLRRAEAEEAVELWCQECAIEHGYKHSPALVRMGFNPDELHQVSQGVRPEMRSLLIEFSTYVLQMFTLMREIQEGSSRISEIVGALKNYSFLGQAPVQNVDVHAGIDNTLVILRSKLKTGVNVTKSYAENVPRITAYGSELNQVWTNIIDNAIDAMHGKGELTIRTWCDESEVVVEIEDNGPGIPEHIQAHIFDPFFTTKEPGKGTGLGLSTTYGIVREKHQGSIQVESRPGRTCFIVRLPLHLQTSDSLPS